MRDLVRKAVIAATAVIAITATTVAVPTNLLAKRAGHHVVTRRDFCKPVENPTR
jgi:hypothetical protein